MRNVLTPRSMATFASNIPFGYRFGFDVIVHRMTAVAEGACRALEIVRWIEGSPPVGTILHKVRTTPDLVCDVPLRRQDKVIVADLFKVALLPPASIYKGNIAFCESNEGGRALKSLEEWRQDAAADRGPHWPSGSSSSAHRFDGGRSGKRASRHRPLFPSQSERTTWTQHQAIAPGKRQPPLKTHSLASNKTPWGQAYKTSVNMRKGVVNSEPIQFQTPGVCDLTFELQISAVCRGMIDSRSNGRIFDS